VLTMDLIASSARRSCLSVPATAPRKLEKAITLGADEVVIDLEDSVTADAKADALSAAVRAVGGWAGAGVAVRVNPPGSPWCHVELTALAALPSGRVTVVVPKVESAGDLAFVDRLLDGAEAASGRAAPLGIQAIIETAEGVSRVEEIAAGSPRLETLILGYADLAASLGRSAAGARDLDAWLPVQHAILVAARRHGLQAIDGPYFGIADDGPFRAAAARGRDLGFDGKWAIHPAQVDALNTLFSPSGEELEQARAVLDVLERSKREGAGAVALDGQMLDEAMRRSALRVLARAHAAGTRT
jgi:citrate lyase subunit beta/citryl-CoA lyase